MILSFKTQINGKPTYFPEKILLSFPDHIWKTEEFGKFLQNGFCIGLYKLFISPVFFHAKKHSIREDRNDRWKVGNKIHFVINNRTKNYFQFAPIAHVQHIQHIRIFYYEGLKAVKIDGRLIAEKEVETLAINDGFDTVEDFWEFFKRKGWFFGKLIHWTDLKY